MLSLGFLLCQLNHQFMLIFHTESGALHLRMKCVMSRTGLGNVTAQKVLKCLLQFQNKVTSFPVVQQEPEAVELCSRK